MNIVTSNKWIGQRTIRPDGVDKVTGRAAFAADTTMPGMIWGKVLRSPHPHARIKSIDTSKAEALPGVKAVVTSRDLVDFPLDKSVMLGIQDMRWMCRNVMARDKALFPGHPVAAVAATSEAIAAHACTLIEVDYEVLPWAIEIDDALKPDAPILHDFMKYRGQAVQHRRQARGQEGRHRARLQARAEVDRSSGQFATTRPVHQGYIEPHACLDQRRRRQQDHDLEFEPGPVHGARHDGVPDRNPAKRHPRHSGGNRRRFWWQDHRLSRTVGDVARQEIRTSGQDGDDPRRGDAGDRADVGLQEHGQDRREKRRHHRRRAGHLLAAGRRAAGLADPRRGRVQLLRPTISRMCCRPASTCSPTAPRSRPIARRARRSAPMRSNACSMNSPKRSRWIRWSCRLEERRQAGHQGRARPCVYPRIGYIETLEAAKAHRRITPHRSASCRAVACRLRLLV